MAGPEEFGALAAAEFALAFSGDADHFGFPGFVEDVEGNDEDQENVVGSEKEGERRGRKAFVGVRRLMEEVQMRDETLMSWIAEMVDAGITGTIS